MKRYMFGFLAVALAIATVSFTSKRTVRTFVFLGGSITNPSAWVAGSSAACNNGAALCAITFDDAQYPLTTTAPINKPNSTVLSLVNTYFSATSHGSDIIDTAPNPDVDTDITVYKKQ